MSITRINSSIYPSEIDTDAELVHVIDRTSALSASSINSLKDSILSIENALGINPQGSFLSVLDRIDQNITSKYIQKSGDEATGSISIKAVTPNTRGISPRNLQNNQSYKRNSIVFGSSKASILFDTGINGVTGTASFKSQLDFLRPAYEGSYSEISLDDILIDRGTLNPDSDNTNRDFWGDLYIWDNNSTTLDVWSAPLNIIGNSATPNTTVNTGDDDLKQYSGKLRRVRMFDDVEVVGNVYMENSFMMTNKLIVDDTNKIDPFTVNDDSYALLVENTLDVHGKLYVDKKTEFVGFRQQRFPYDPHNYEYVMTYHVETNGIAGGDRISYSSGSNVVTLQGGDYLSEKEIVGGILQIGTDGDIHKIIAKSGADLTLENYNPATSGTTSYRIFFNENIPATKLSNYLINNENSDILETINDTSKYTFTGDLFREILTDNVRVSGEVGRFRKFTREVFIPKNETNPYDFLLVYFGANMIMRGGMSLWIRDENSTASNQNSHHEIKWPNIHNFNMHDFRLGADIYSMSCQAVIPVASDGAGTRGTSWNGRDASEVDESTLAAFDNTLDNYIYIDFSVEDAPNRSGEIDWLVEDWNSSYAGRDLSEVPELNTASFPKVWPPLRNKGISDISTKERHKIDIDSDGSTDVIVGQTFAVRSEIDDIMPYAAYYPYIYVIGVKDTAYEFIS